MSSSDHAFTSLAFLADIALRTALVAFESRSREESRVMLQGMQMTLEWMSYNSSSDGASFISSFVILAGGCAVEFS